LIYSKFPQLNIEDFTFNAVRQNESVLCTIKFTPGVLLERRKGRVIDEMTRFLSSQEAVIGTRSVQYRSEARNAQGRKYVIGNRLGIHAQTPETQRAPV
jgi:hypothetical protein